ncbi:hypothetical protein TrVFT333_001010 [Trichoderma virens FT-333]|nr:hypothetical protein TrVFT333_001010 [Trichoderma virens FT-333]
MHIFISGATGRNGRLALDNALSRGHTITVLTRNPSSLPSNPNLTVIKGSPSSPKTSPQTLPGPPRHHNQRPPRRNCRNALRPPPKIIVNSLFGARDSWQNLSWPFRAVMSHSTMKIAVKDHNNMDTLIRDSGVPFVFARPARLTEGPAAEVKVWPDDGQGCGWNVVISRESLAAWMVRAAESDEWDGKSPVLTN